MADYDCKTEAANRLADKVREWVPEPAKAKAGIFYDKEPGPILKAYEALGLKDIITTSDISGLFNKVFDIVSLSFANCPADEAVYLVYDLFKQRRFSGRALLCTNFFGESAMEHLEKRITEVLNQDSSEGFFMDVPREERAYVRNNMKNSPLTSALMLCSRADYKLTTEILDVDFEPEPEAELNLPVASQVAQGVQRVTIGSSGGFTTRGRAIQCSVEQGEQLIYAAFSNKALPYTIQDVTNFFYKDGGINVYGDIMLISDCAGLIKRVKPLIRGKDQQKGYVLDGSGKKYGVNLRTFSELAVDYDKHLKRIYFLMRMLEGHEDITLPFITVKEAKKLLQEGISPKNILSQYAGVTDEEVRSLAERFCAQPKKAEHVETRDVKIDEDKTEGNGKSCDEYAIARARETTAKGVIVYDSETKRLLKNASRLGCVQAKTTTHIRNVKSDVGLESFGPSGVYVLNTFDSKFEDALNYLLNRFLGSGERLNLVFLGRWFDEGGIKDAIELGVDVHFASVPINQAYIDEKQPVDLEGVIDSMLKLN